MSCESTVYMILYYTFRPLLNPLQYRTTTKISKWLCNLTTTQILLDEGLISYLIVIELIYYIPVFHLDILYPRREWRISLWRSLECSSLWSSEHSCKQWLLDYILIGLSWDGEFCSHCCCYFFVWHIQSRPEHRTVSWLKVQIVSCIGRLLSSLHRDRSRKVWFIGGFIFRKTNISIDTKHWWFWFNVSQCRISLL